MTRSYADNSVPNPAFPWPRWIIPLRLLPSPTGYKACSIFRIGREPLSLFLAGKVSHRETVSFDGPPTLRRPMRPELYRHHLIGFVGIVCHLPFAFSPEAGRTPSVDGSPSVSRRWATEPFPRSGRPKSVASEASRISPTVFQPAAVTAFRILVENRTLSRGVSSGSSGAG
jgi:hypothetical protein